jgi:hypothetical protein
MMNPTIKSWLSKSREELDEIYRSCETPSTIPTGDTRGTAIIAGSIFAKAFAAFARMFAWQGKVFDLYGEEGQSGILLNKVTPFSLTFVIAKVYREDSWMDQRPTIVIDYSKTSLIFGAIRDEIREIEPGVYLGKVWWGKTHILDFALSTKQ